MSGSVVAQQTIIRRPNPSRRLPLPGMRTDNPDQPLTFEHSRDLFDGRSSRMTSSSHGVVRMYGPCGAPGLKDKTEKSDFFRRRWDKGLQAIWTPLVRENGPRSAAPALLLESTRGRA
jgi:hypothetical protein